MSITLKGNLYWSPFTPDVIKYNASCYKLPASTPGVYIWHTFAARFSLLNVDRHELLPARRVPSSYYY